MRCTALLLYDEFRVLPEFPQSLFSLTVPTLWLMKILTVCFSILTASAQLQETDQPATPASAPVYVVGDQGLNYRTINVIRTEQRGDRTVTRTNAIVTLASGLSKLVHGQYIDADNEIEILDNGGAVARKTAYEVVFPENANDLNKVLTLTTPEGKVFRTQCVGLALTEAGSGRSAWVAELRDSVGTLVGKNKAVYPGALGEAGVIIPPFPAQPSPS